MVHKIKWVDVNKRKPNRFDANREGYVWCWPATPNPSDYGKVTNAHYTNVGSDKFPHIQKWAKVKGSVYDDIPEPPL